jgi:hypothetical protein
MPHTLYCELFKSRGRVRNVNLRNAGIVWHTYVIELIVFTRVRKVLPTAQHLKPHSPFLFPKAPNPDCVDLMGAGIPGEYM